VLPNYQGQGLGNEIVARLLCHARGHRKIILYAAPGKEGFYERFGFRPMKTAMAIFPDPAAAVARGYLEGSAGTITGLAAIRRPWTAEPSSLSL
jgi:predicted N-acetyltransferase YhbS